MWSPVPAGNSSCKKIVTRWGLPTLNQKYELKEIHFLYTLPSLWYCDMSNRKQIKTHKFQMQSVVQLNKYLLNTVIEPKERESMQGRPLVCWQSKKLHRYTWRSSLRLFASLSKKYGTPFDETMVWCISYNRSHETTTKKHLEVDLKILRKQKRKEERKKKQHP